MTETSEDDTVGWLTHTISSRQDICHFRILSEKCYASYFQTFGEVLGDRIFRHTKVGGDDLQALSQQKALNRHIRSVTFGNAQFAELPGDGFEVGFRGLTDADRRRLTRAFQEAYLAQVQYQSDRCSDFEKRLAGVLKQFPNLKAWRLLTNDLPTLQGSHLGGWLGPGDKELLPQTELIRDIARVYQVDALYDMNDRSGNFELLLNASSSAGISIEDFRARVSSYGSDSYIVPWITTPHIADKLRHVRLELCSMLSCNRRVTVGFFRNLLDLRSAWLTLASDEVPCHHFSIDTTGLLNMFRPHTGLEKLVIKGEWTYVEDEMVSLFDDCKSLSKFVLQDPVLAKGTWASVVERLICMDTNRMRLLEFSSIYMGSSTGRLAPAFDTVTWQEFVEDIQPCIAQGACTVYLSPEICEYASQSSQQ